MDSQVTFYGPAFSTYVRSVRLCCEEKGVEYTLEEQISKAGWAMLNSPFKRVPILKHANFVLYESAAICRYIDRTFAGPGLSPKNRRDLARMDQWISAANCYFDPAFVRNFVLEYAFPKSADGKPDHNKINGALPEVYKQLEIANEALKNTSYFSGDEAGIADYLIIPMIDYLARSPNGMELLDDAPNVSNYLTRMRTRESCQKILVPPQL